MYTSGWPFTVYSIQNCRKIWLISKTITTFHLFYMQVIYRYMYKL